MTAAAIIGFILGLILIVVLVAMYFAPTIIAVMRKHHNLRAVAALNALLGWTCIGWVAAFVWSLTNRV